MAEDVESFSGMLRLALGDRLATDATGFVDMVAEDGIMEFPYAPDGLPDRLEGRTAIAAHLAALGKLIVLDRIGAPQVHATTDPDTTIIEFEGFGQGVTTGASYNQRYISVVTTRGGRIVHYRDYWNPLVVLQALKGLGINEATSVAGLYGR